MKLKARTEERLPRTLEPSHQPGQASVEQGVVLLDGPHGVAVAMTSSAARATGESLCQAAEQADACEVASPEVVRRSSTDS
jgi:hypothetical protein